MNLYKMNNNFKYLEIYGVIIINYLIIIYLYLFIFLSNYFILII